MADLGKWIERRAGSDVEELGGLCRDQLLESAGLLFGLVQVTAKLIEVARHISHLCQQRPPGLGDLGRIGLLGQRINHPCESLVEPVASPSGLGEFVADLLEHARHVLPIGHGPATDGGREGLQLSRLLLGQGLGGVGLISYGCLFRAEPPHARASCWPIGSREVELR